MRQKAGEERFLPVRKVNTASQNDCALFQQITSKYLISKITSRIIRTGKIEREIFIAEIIKRMSINFCFLFTIKCWSGEAVSEVKLKND